MKRATEYMFDIEGPLKEGELRSCPFCDSSRTIRVNQDNDIYYIMCDNCKASGAVGDSKEDAEFRWNVRMGR